MHEANSIKLLYRGVSKDDPESVLIHQAEEGIAIAFFKASREADEATGHIYDSTVITSYFAGQQRWKSYLLYVLLTAPLSATKETIEKFVKEYGDEVVIDYDLNKINDHKSHSFYNVTSFEAFAKILDTPFAREWDKDNICKDIVYRLEGPLQVFVIG